MLADARSLDALDFARIRERVAGQTHSARAADRAVTLEPSVDGTLVRRLVTETAEMRTLIGSHGFAPAGIAEVEGALEGAARGSVLPATELRAIADASAAVAAAVRAIREADAELPVLRAACAVFLPLPAVIARVVDAIDERGTVLDRASPALARTRRALVHAHDDARERTTALARSSRYARAIQDAIVTVRDGRFVIPIKAEFAGEFPGIVHDTSASGHTLFVEPLETLETNNRVRALRAQEEHEIARILAELSALVGAQADGIRANLALHVELDLAYARAAVAERMNAVEPQLVDEATIDVFEGRHPLLDARAVPQSIRLDDEIRATIISGPNMGGKTVALKMVGLFVAMTACGMHVPATTAAVGRFSRIFADIGDEQSIALNASTFSAHLASLAEIVSDAGDRSLILIDEIGAGTEPNAGAALAVAVLERFIAVGSRCLVTTHATELKLFGAEHAHARNASVRFDPDTYAPTYHLDLGTPGQSLAFPLARTMRLDRDVIARAEALLTAQERDYERALDELAHERVKTTAAREALERDRSHLRVLEDQARKRIETLERERREVATQGEARLAAALREFSAELERRASAGERARPRVTRGQSELLARTIDDLRAGLGIRASAGERGKAAPIGLGDTVTVLALEQDGTVVEDHGDDATVQLGALRMTVAKSGLRRRGGPASARAGRTEHAGAARLAAATNARSELDVRGKRFVEAEPLVDQWIDESALAGASPLRLIHGKGTGLLGRGLQEYLRAHPQVRHVRYGSAEEGGSGVTMFELA